MITDWEYDCPEIPDGWRMLATREVKQEGDKFFVKGIEWRNCKNFGDVAGNLNWVIRKIGVAEKPYVPPLLPKEKIAKYFAKLKRRGLLPKKSLTTA